jgi:prepilin-type processing-associated H-X9-DG protein
VLGVLAPLTCGATAPFALLFGYLALRRVNLSDGRLPGARAARAGMVLGAAGIVLFFAGLFVVGLYELRGKSEVTVCTNNLRRIGLAVNLYHDDKEHAHFPSGNTIFGELEPDQCLSWMVLILPYMESEPGANGPASFRKGEELYARFDVKRGWHDGVNQEANQEAMSVTVPWFVCPAGRHLVPARSVWTTYVGIGGLGMPSPNFGKDSPGAGFFGWNRVITRADVTRGVAETMIVTERAHDLGAWTRGGWGTVTGVDPAAQPYVPRQFGGLHPHGANVLFADAHVSFVSDRANPVVWEEQSRIHRDEGGERWRP